MKDVISKNQVLIKYIIVGGLAFIAEYLSFVFFYEVMNLPTLVANSISFCFGLFTSFTCQRYWTFASKEKQYDKHIAKQLTLYLILSVINFALSTVVIGLLVHFVLPPHIAKLVTQVVVAFWNYFVLRQKIFTIET